MGLKVQIKIRSKKKIKKKSNSIEFPFHLDNEIAM